MKNIFSRILTIGGVVIVAAGVSGYLNRGSNLHEYAIFLAIGGAVLVVVGYLMGREVQVAQRATVMMQQKQKRRYQIVVRLVVLAAAALVGYFLLAFR